MKLFRKIIAFIQGKIRYKLYYSKYRWLIPNHIVNQIQTRILSMDDVCYREGSCQICGCETTALQMANKACDKPCYPRMMNKFEWRVFKEIGFGKISGVDWELTNGIFVANGKVENEK